VVSSGIKTLIGLVHSVPYAPVEDSHTTSVGYICLYVLS
jgi:hypothetical protein